MEKTEREWLLNELKDQAEYMESEGYPSTADTIRMALDALKNEPKAMEIEGGGSSWWYVCPECHGAIDSKDRFCRHCGQAVKE